MPADNSLPTLVIFRHLQGILDTRNAANLNVGATIGRPKVQDIIGSKRASNARPYIFYRYNNAKR